MAKALAGTGLVGLLEARVANLVSDLQEVKQAYDEVREAQDGIIARLDAIDSAIASLSVQLQDMQDSQVL